VGGTLLGISGGALDCPEEVDGAACYLMGGYSPSSFHFLRLPSLLLWSSMPSAALPNDQNIHSVRYAFRERIVLSALVFLCCNCPSLFTFSGRAWHRICETRARILHSTGQRYTPLSRFFLLTLSWRSQLGIHCGASSRGCLRSDNRPRPPAN